MSRTGPHFKSRLLVLLVRFPDPRRESRLGVMIDVD